MKTGFGMQERPLMMLAPKSWAGVSLVGEVAYFEKVWETRRKDLRERLVTA